MIHGYVLLSVICAAAGFNIFMKPVRHFQNKDDSLFGQTIIESQEGVLVTSPSSPARLLHCTVEKEKCAEVYISENVKKGLKPIVSAAEKADGHQHMVCQQVRKKKAINEDLNGDCTLLRDQWATEELSPSSLVVEEMKMNNIRSSSNDSNNHRGEIFKRDLDRRSPRSRRHTHSNSPSNHEEEDEEDSGTEIAFVLDGSGSINPDDFVKAKDFISNVMKTVWKTCFTCDFAIVQYGKDIRTELSLLENDNGTKSIEKVKSIKQIMNYTKTASAINHVLEDVFVPENGSKPNAKKIIIVITDGRIFLDEMDLTDVLNSPKIKNITRYAIGVGDVLVDAKGMEELKEIASDPDEQHLFKVNDYARLDEILSNLEKTITGIEGIQQGAGFHFELAEAGFSSHFAHDGSLLFGAVGAYDWSGGLILKSPQHGRVTFLNDSSMGARFSYLGYSVTSAQGLTETLYISGAPRHSLTGSVLVFNSKSHLVMQTLPGYQVGSYFGSALCVLDFDKDGKTDYLLVGAPHYHVKGEEGKVYVYKLNQALGRFDPEGTERRGEDGHLFAMFGSAIADLGDLDGNGFTDVAVGAPLETNEASASSGSIYIYNGYEGGIQPLFSQRIPAADLVSKLRFFGRSISRMSVAGKNGVQYISVGGEGGVIVLQTLPVIVFQPRMTVTPTRLHAADNTQVTLKICFNTKRGNIKEGQLPISYQVDLDDAQASKRLSFANGVSKAAIFYLTPHKECLDTFKLKFTGCHDCYSPILIKMRFSLLHNNSAGPPLRVLNQFRPTEHTTKLEFQRDCDKCVSDVSLSDSRLSTNMIVVGHTNNLNLAFNLTNRGDGSYLTALILTFPNILLYNKVQPSDSLVACQNEITETQEERSHLKCNIMHPVMKRGDQVSFSISWQIVGKKTELRTTRILANLTSANNGGQVLDNKSFKSVVKNALRIQLMGKANPEYLIIKPEDKTDKNNLTFTFEIFGENKYNASLFVNIRIRLQAGGTELEITEVSKGKCNFTRGHLKTAPDFYLLRCAVGELQDTIVIKAEAFIKHFEDSSEKIMAEATLEFDRDHYELIEKGSLSELVQVLLIRPETVSSTAALIGGSIGGFLFLAIIILILIKCGFFRSRYSVEQADGTD